ncbi:hypothetical protein TG4357_03178 [Thalassovita gelatinovora]|uniref:Uncharacterized protein n=1 Tax=Thalassovita gelatinovora TaxID=53501 RepID=A0A0P1FIE5_THAGE|nr:DUF6524 family protein [Thalassovita gelatinovora]QIZ82144.1 hypothetical protein HFZ77_17505 [Thalassovita gelatinovora]CUH67733.1 hypothetical protein TG4357_03178 [Thalassovita gelatinovora]SEP68516.1 hypothetical protein SAMN04488043_10182 [Thalassovita gelatinovora]
MGLLLRWVVVFILLTATFNPTEWNYTAWAMKNYNEQLPMAVLLGLLLTIGYIVYLRATLRSIGGFGMFLILAVIAALIWVLYDYKMLDLNNPTVNTWIGLFALSIVLGIGLSWSHIRRMLSGQYDIDDVDE